MCAKQIANLLIDLPENFVIVTGTKQLTDTLSEGLKGIKHKYKKYSYQYYINKTF